MYALENGSSVASDLRYLEAAQFYESAAFMSTSSWQRAATPTGSAADQIMDRIDSHIRGIKTDARFASTLPKTPASYDMYHSSNVAGVSAAPVLPESRQPAATNASVNDDAASTSTMLLMQNFNPGDLKNIDMESDLGTDLGAAATVVPKLNIASMERSRASIPEPDAEVSSVVAMQINEQYREVFNRKQTMDPYQSDNETVRTEDFANRYQELQQAAMQLPSSGADKAAGVEIGLGNVAKTDSAREIIERANSIIDRYKNSAAADANAAATTMKSQVFNPAQNANVARNYVAVAARQSNAQSGARGNEHRLERLNASRNATRTFKLLSPLASGSQTPVDAHMTSAVASHSVEASLRPIASVSNNMQFKNTSSFSRGDIKRESERIKSEMEVERRKRMQQDTPARMEFAPIAPVAKPPQTTQSHGRDENDIARERLYAKLTELEEINGEIKHLRTDRDRVGEEMERMNELLKRQQEEIRMSERISKSSKSRADELKQETAVLQVKRDSTVHELEQLTHELAGRRSKLVEMEAVLGQRLRELRDYQSLGLSREEVQRIVAERNDLFQLVATIEERELEKYELEKRLTVAEEDRLIEQEQFKERVGELEEELQTRVSQIEDLLKENETLQLEIRGWKEQVAEFQHNHEQTLSDAAANEERLRQQMQRDLNDIQKQSTDEIVALKTQIIDLRKLLAQQEKEINLREQSIGNMNSEKQDLLDQVRQVREEAERRMREVELIKSNETTQLYDQMRKDSESAILELEERMKSERQRALLRIEQKHAEELQESASALSNAENEIASLKEKILMLESNCDDLHAYYSRELEEKVQMALAAERRKFESELDAASQSAHDETLRMRHERDKTVQQLNEEIESLRKHAAAKDNELQKCNDELERQKEHYRVSLLEKQNELLKVRAEIRDTCQAELSKIRDSMQKDADSDRSKRKVTIEEYRTRLEQAQSRLTSLDEAQKTAAHSHASLLRGVVEEVNSNCQLLAQAIGVTPKITKSDGIQIGHDNKAIVKTALATLKACCEEVREHMLESQRDFESVKTQLASFQSSHGDEISSVRAKHTKELDDLRDRLAKQYGEQMKQLTLEHNRSLQNAARRSDAELTTLKSSLESWKHETAQKLAASIQQDLRAEYERKIRDLKQEIIDREQELAVTRTEIVKGVAKASASAVGEESATKLIATLQDRLRQLREQNIELHRMLSIKRLNASNPDLQQSLFDAAAPLSSVSHQATSTTSSTAARYRERERERERDASSRHLSPSSQPFAIDSLRLQPATTATATATAGTFSFYDRDLLTFSERFEEQVEQVEQVVPPLNFNVDTNGHDVYERSKDLGLAGLDKHYESIRTKLPTSSANRSVAGSVASFGSAKPSNGGARGHY